MKISITGGLITITADGREGKQGELEFIIFPDHFEIKRIFIKEPFRRQGMAKAMLNFLKNMAKGKNYRIIVRSSTDPEREVFGKFLEDEGFVKTEESLWEFKNIN